MERSKWTSRTFTFDLPVGWLPNIAERLFGTTIRIRDLVSGIGEKDAARCFGDSWCIKQHIGHLADLEDLHLLRLKELAAGKTILSAADMQNRKTEQAGHQTENLKKLIDTLRTHRDQFIDQLLTLDEKVHERQALHPRLGINMRAVDIAYFTAEHDDHHLATIRQIVTQLKRQAGT